MSFSLPDEADTFLREKLSPNDYAIFCLKSGLSYELPTLDLGQPISLLGKLPKRLSNFIRRKHIPTLRDFVTYELNRYDSLEKALLSEPYIAGKSVSLVLLQLANLGWNIEAINYYRYQARIKTDSS